ncbi:MAG: molybdopterin-dependent oxidoreductase, partial [Candidatus Tectomicrobia bacterium]|nr:molybdopterin-dependent oxidoreductase [Candidatus Tectomicrobia bacterium]
MNLSRRDFMKLGMAAGAIVAGGGPLPTLSYSEELARGGASFSLAGKKRQAVPSSCLQCVAVCGIVGHVEDGRLAKIEGNPLHPNNRGRICPRGQAGVNQVYDPDRVLYPMRRVGARGEGKWKRVSWDEALSEVASRLKKLREEGHPEKFMFHYGRNRAGWITGPFLAAYGTKTIGNHTSICEVGKFTGQELTWGVSYDINDVAHTRYMLNFGASVLEAHTSHNYFAQRVMEGMERGAKLVTFDVRLSNTAAKSHEWIPVKPGTDGLVALAMANVIMQEGLFDRAFIETWTNVTVAELKAHLAQYTPEKAEAESGVPAATLRRLAREFATTKPSTVISYRGLVAHEYGAMNERCARLLDAIVGNIEAKGGTLLIRKGSWGKPKSPKIEVKGKKLDIIDGENIAYPTHHVGHQVLRMIKDGKKGRPEVYMTYVYNPVYANGEVEFNRSVLKDESLIPFLVAVDAYMSESTELADLILPDATYLERYDPEAPQSYALIPFVALRQPVVKPLGEARAFQDVLLDLARRIGGDMPKFLPWKDSEDYVRQAAAQTSGLKGAGGFERIRREGVFVQSTKVEYQRHAKQLSAEQLKGTKVDPKTGVVFKGGDAYTADKQYVGQMVKGKAYAGFKPDKIPKSGLIEIKSQFLAKKGFPALPSYLPIKAHQAMGEDDLILTTFKVNVQTQSRTQNCKWLDEIFHSNPAWMNPGTAAARGLKNGDKVRVKSAVGEIVT